MMAVDRVSSRWPCNLYLSNSLNCLPSLWSLSCAAPAFVLLSSNVTVWITEISRELLIIYFHSPLGAVRIVCLIDFQAGSCIRLPSLAAVFNDYFVFVNFSFSVNFFTAKNATSPACVTALCMCETPGWDLRWEDPWRAPCTSRGLATASACLPQENEL